jgi:glycosyltransferase involved in cell wall biosynthesis
MLLSVIIATYNRSEVLKQNLDCFKQQTDKNFEVVVGIDGSTDNTKEMLANYQPDFEIRWVDSGETNKYCLAKVRNMALVETKGRAVVILDDDSYPTPEFVAQHKSSIRPKTLTGGYRNSHDPKDPMHSKMARYLSSYGVLKPTKMKEILVENNCSMLRKDWIGCGMFSERFEGYGGCGQEFFLRLMHQGFDYQFNPNAMIFHHKEFEGDNGLTRDNKMEQAREMGKLINKHTWSYNG